MKIIEYKLSVLIFLCAFAQNIFASSSMQCICECLRWSLRVLLALPACQAVKLTEWALQQHTEWLPQQDLGYNPAPEVHHHMVLIFSLLI